MKIFITFFALTIINLSYSQQWEWAKRISGLANDYTSDVFVDDSLNVYVTGRTKAASTFYDDINPISPVNYGHTDAFIAKYDKNGNLKWATQMGSPLPEWGWGITVDKDGYVYCTGELSDTSVFGLDTIISNGNRDVFITKLDNNGNYIWTKSFGNTNTDKGKSITTDNLGNIYVTGFINDQVNVGGQTIGTTGVMNAFIVKMDSAGNYIHVKDISPKYSGGYKIKSDHNGNIYLAGELLYNNYIAGFEVLGPTGLAWRDAFLAKLDSSLQTQWVNLVKGSFHNVGEDIAFNNNYVYLTGCYSYISDFSGISLTYNGNGTNATTINASRDAFISKYDLDGNIIWAKGFGGKGLDYAYGIDVSKNDNIYFSGYFEDTVMFDNYQLISAGYNDMFITKLDSNGNVIWAKQQGNSDHEYNYCLRIDSAQNIYTGGTYQTAQNFDSTSLLNTQYDAVIGKIVQPPYVNYNTDTVITYCETDTISLTINTITTPVNFQYNLTPSGWFLGNTYYFITTPSTPNVYGQILVSNNIYTDTININIQYNVSSPLNFTLGNDTTLCDSVPFILSAPSGQNNYLWSTNETTPNISVNQNGNYWVQITNTDNCISSDSIQLTFNDCSGITDLTIFNLQYLQNDKILINTSNHQFNINIYTIDGKLIYQSKNKTIIDVGSLKKGLYIINVFDETTHTTQKFVIN
jgi:hypothetical protein